MACYGVDHDQEVRLSGPQLTPTGNRESLTVPLREDRLRGHPTGRKNAISRSFPLSTFTMFQRYIDEHLNEAPDTCTFFKPGHKVHWIQTKQGLQKNTFRPAEIIAVDGNWITFESDEVIHHQWTHSTRAIAQLLDGLLRDDNLELEHSERYFMMICFDRSHDSEVAVLRHPLCLSNEPSDCSIPVEPGASASGMDLTDVIRRTIENGGGIFQVEPPEGRE